MLAMRREGRRRKAWHGWAGVLVLVGAVSLGAAGAQQEQGFTLHAYADLVQVPALVLDARLRPLRHAVDPERFMVSLDSGKRFSPTKVRVEGDDPLDVAIVLDVSGSQKKLVESFPGAALELASALRPQDHISIYALDCAHLQRSAERIAPDAKAVQEAMKNVLASRRAARRLDGVPCENRILLWSSMVAVVKELQESPARLAMLVVSDGEDRGSQVTWSEVHSVAGLHGVAVFGLRDSVSDGVKDRARRAEDALMPEDAPDRFRDLCGSTGGIMLSATPSTVGKTLRQWVDLLRGRYVIEFPRPKQMGAGLHSIVVSIQGNPGAFVTVAGVPVTVPDAAQMADPSRVHSDAGADIPMGNRRPLVDGK